MACLSALKACDVALRHLRDRLVPLCKPGLKSTLMWPFQASSIEQHLGLLSRQKATLSLALSAYQARLLATHVRKAARENKATRTSKVANWFKASNPEQNHAACREKWEPGTATWVFDEDEFISWQGAAGGLLWVHGIPGAGKTILCSTIIDHLGRATASGGDADGGAKRMTYYYFDFSDSRKHGVVNMLKSVIYQLLCATPRESEAATALYNGRREGTEEPTMEELVSLLMSEIALTEVTYLVIDALDECPGPRGERQVLFKGFLNAEKLPENLKILVTSRQEPDIEAALNSIVTHKIGIQNCNVDDDVSVYVKREIERDATLMRWQPAMKKEILDAVVMGAHGMFRWAVCQLDAIKQCLTPAMVRKELGRMPEDLDHTYDRILQALPPRHQAFVKNALRWLAFSARPLLLEELAEAAVVDSSEADFQLDLARFIVPTSILDVCGVLVTVSTIGDEYSSIRRPEWLNQKVDVETEAGADYPDYFEQQYTVVSLSHYSVKEYITSQRLSTGSLSPYHTSARLAHSHIAQCCVQYLLSYNEGEIAFDFRINEFPLLEYASRNWMLHWSQALGDAAGAAPPSGMARDILERFLAVDPSKCQPYLNWLNIYDPEYKHKPSRERWPLRSFRRNKSYSLEQRPTTLYWAVKLGDLALVRGLVERGADAHRYCHDAYLGTALSAAAARPSLEIVEYLLSRGVDPNAPNRRHGSVLQIAARSGSSQVVQRLLAAGADANHRGGEENSPAMAAALRRHYRLVELLVERGGDTGGRGTTEALHQAAKTGDLEMVERLLLRAGADASRPDIRGRTPLSLAVRSGSLPVVASLLRHGADVNVTARYGRDRQHFPLTAAAENGFAEIASALLRAGANPNPPDGVPPLVAAVRSGHLAVVVLLLDADADPAAPDSPYHLNSFHAAVDCRHFAIARLLLERFPDVPCGDATFLDAVRFYDECPAILELLVGRGANMDALGDAGSALHVALLVQSRAAAWRILSHNPYIHTMTSIGTPLTAAIEAGFTDIAKELIRRGASVHRRRLAEPSKSMEHVGFESQRRAIPKWLETIRMCRHLSTWERASSPFEAAVELACKMNSEPESEAESDSDSDSDSDSEGEREEEESTEMIDLLIDQGVDLQDEGEDIGDSLFWPIFHEAPSILRYLAAKGIDLNRPFSRQACNAIQYAAKENEVKLIKLLLELGVDVDGPPGGQGTSLYCGFLSKSRETVALLLDNGAKIVERTSEGDTSNVLVPAIECGLGDEFLPRLLDMGASVNLADDSAGAGPLPLAVAVYSGNRGLAELLTRHGARFADPEWETLADAASKKPIHEIRWLLELAAEAGLSLSSDEEQGTPLMEASAMGRKDVIRLLLEAGANLNSSSAAPEEHVPSKGTAAVDFEAIRADDMRPRGALAAAVAQDDIDTAAFLLERGADPNSWGRSAICIALNHGCVAMIDLLFRHGADIRSERNHRYFAHAAWGGEGALSRLLQEPLSAAQRRKGVDVALQAALSVADPSISLWLLDQHGADVQARGGLFGSPLQAALAPAYPTPGAGVYDRRCLLADMLLDRGADPNALPAQAEVDDETVARGRTLKFTMVACPLVLAIRVGPLGDRYSGDHAHLVRKLLAAGANPNGSGRDDKDTPLQAAAHDTALVQLLLAAGADANAVTDTKLGTALHAAALAQNPESIKLLLAAGASVHAHAGKYGSVVHCAAKVGKPGSAGNRQAMYTRSVRAMELLAAAGADVLARGGRYGSALQAAAKAGNLDGMIWLIEKGADVYALGGKWGHIHNAAVKTRKWGVISWLERCYGREVWHELDRKLLSETASHGGHRSGEEPAT
ncbi:ankyrin repeat-containing domain protein [Lasiosphaeris hirsuta]|uniref:Ankyrin repeat-containing domain protein n=1 Tax=Lasiosphaeris hirsuta TaxID=260670 RepID=A0AA40A1Y9_9PEZI|nr:ankyrin repeat-containing domain protein [Lasiosphaeris hirsuta]